MVYNEQDCENVYLKYRGLELNSGVAAAAFFLLN